MRGTSPAQMAQWFRRRARAVPYLAHVTVALCFAYSAMFAAGLQPLVQKRTLFFVAITKTDFRNFKKLVTKYEIRFQAVLDLVYLKSIFFRFHEI